MACFEAKMHQICFRLGLRLRPRWGAYSAPPDSLSGFKGPTFNGKGGEGLWDREVEEREWGRCLLIRDVDGKGREKVNEGRETVASFDSVVDSQLNKTGTEKVEPFWI